MCVAVSCCLLVVIIVTFGCGIYKLTLHALVLVSAPVHSHVCMSERLLLIDFISPKRQRHTTPKIRTFKPFRSFSLSSVCSLHVCMSYTVLEHRKCLSSSLYHLLLNIFTICIWALALQCIHITYTARTLAVPFRLHFARIPWQARVNETTESIFTHSSRASMRTKTHTQLLCVHWLCLYMTQTEILTHPATAVQFLFQCRVSGCVCAFLCVNQSIYTARTYNSFVWFERIETKKEYKLCVVCSSPFWSFGRVTCIFVLCGWNSILFPICPFD